jgi:IS30 family transposase
LIVKPVFPIDTIRENVVKMKVGLLCQYFPKAMGLLDVTLKEVIQAVHQLDERPRKCLGFKVPCEVFEEKMEAHMRSVFEIALIT